MSFSADDLDAVGEGYTKNDLRHLLVAIEPSPAPLGGLGQLEDHGERGLVRQAALSAHGAVADGREGALDRVRNQYVVCGAPSTAACPLS